MEIPRIDGERVQLRGLRVADAPILATQFRERDIGRFLPFARDHVTKETAIKFINACRRMARQNRSLYFAIERSSDSALMGVVEFKNINRSDQNAEVGYWLGRKYRGRGYCAEALNLVLGLAFGDMKLHRIYAVVLSENTPSVKLLEKMGFTREGSWREGSRVGRRFVDVYAYGMLKREFKTSKDT